MNPSRGNHTLTVLAIVGLVMFFVFHSLTSMLHHDPDAAGYTVQVGKGKAAEEAEAFVSDLFGASPAQSLVMYQNDKLLSGYIQRSRLSGEYFREFHDRFPLDYYRVEVRSKEDIYYYVDIHMRHATVVGWRADASLPAGLANTGVQQAVEQAADYLRREGFPPESYTVRTEELSSGHRIIFQHREERIGEARQEYHLEVAGDQVVSFHPRFALPEGDLAWMEQQNRSASRMGNISLLLSLLMTAAAVYYIVRRRRQVQFGRGLVLTSLFTLGYWMNHANLYPAIKGMTGTGPASDWAAVFTLVMMNVIVLLMAASVYLCFIAGDQLWREEGRRLWPSWQTPGYGRHVMDAMKLGYLFCFVLLGLQAFLLFIGHWRFDVWTISDPSNSPYNLLWPGLFPFLAWMAAISEEAIYRLFGIILFKKLTRSNALAVLLPSIIWALGHTQYPVYPVYTRLVEVTLLGLLFGYIFLKYGLIPALFAHATMDIVLFSLGIMGLGGAAPLLAGLFHLALPAVLAWCIWRLHAWFRRRPDPAPPRPEAPQ